MKRVFRCLTVSLLSVFAVLAACVACSSNKIR